MREWSHSKTVTHALQMLSYFKSIFKTKRVLCCVTCCVTIMDSKVKYICFHRPTLVFFLSLFLLRCGSFHLLQELLCTTSADHDNVKREIQGLCQNKLTWGIFYLNQFTDPNRVKNMWRGIDHVPWKIKWRFHISPTINSAFHVSREKKSFYTISFSYFG